MTAITALTLGLSACASGAGEAASPPPTTDAPAPATSAAPTATPTPASPTPTAPTLADLDGTWCEATDAATCMTITDGMTDAGATVEPRDDDEGAPCLSASVSDGDGGFVVFYCPAGMTPTTPVTTEEGSTLDLNNQGYDRLFATQAPPSVQTWYRQDDLSAATTG